MDLAVFETLSKIFDADTNIRGNAEKQLQTLQSSPGKWFAWIRPEMNFMVF